MTAYANMTSSSLATTYPKALAPIATAMAGTPWMYVIGEKVGAGCSLFGIAHVQYYASWMDDNYLNKVYVFPNGDVDWYQYDMDEDYCYDSYRNEMGELRVAMPSELWRLMQGIAYDVPKMRADGSYGPGKTIRPFTA